jgi:hypothetical protein
VVSSQFGTAVCFPVLARSLPAQPDVASDSDAELQSESQSRRQDEKLQFTASNEPGQSFFPSPTLCHVLLTSLNTHSRRLPPRFYALQQCNMDPQGSFHEPSDQYIMRSRFQLFGSPRKYKHFVLDCSAVLYLGTANRGSGGAASWLG